MIYYEWLNTYAFALTYCFFPQHFKTTSFNTDAAGLNQIRFDRKGQLVTVGNSGHQMTIWDLRSKSIAASRYFLSIAFVKDLDPLIIHE